MSISDLSADLSADLPVETGQGARTVSARVTGAVVALALAVTGLFFITRSWQLSFGDFGVPGPGVFPFLLGVALFGVAMAITAEELRNHDRGATLAIGHRDVAAVFVALLALSALFESAGAYAALGIMSAVLLKMLARVSILTAVLSAAVGMVLVWAAFKVLLGVELPVGPF
jgi:putative tricarboxylic transport membrane protein